MYAPSSSKSELRHLLMRAQQRLNEFESLNDKFTDYPAKNFADLSLVIEDMARRYEEPFRLAVVGDFKVGKSSFINTILGGDQEFVSEGVTPTTGSVTELWWGEEKKGRVINRSGEVIFDGNIEEAAKYADQRTPQGKKVSKQGARVLLYLPLPMLRHLVVIDTPGLGANERDDEATLSALHHADAAVLVLNARRPGGESAANLADRLRRANARMLCVLTRADECDEHQLDLAKKEAQEQFGDVIEGTPVLFSSTHVSEALKLLKAATIISDDFDKKTSTQPISEDEIRNAEKELERWGFEELQMKLSVDYFAGDSTAAVTRDNRILSELNNQLESLVRAVTSELDAAENVAKQLESELAETERHVNEILAPKLHPLNAKIEDQVRHHIAEFIESLAEAVDIFIEKALDQGFSGGLSAIKVKIASYFDDSASHKHEQKIEREFKELFPDKMMEMTIDDIERAVKRLLVMEWQTGASVLQKKTQNDHFKPNSLIEQINSHLRTLTALLIAEIATFIGLLFATGGIAVVGFALANSLAAAGAHGTARKADIRLSRIKREARMRLRTQRLALSANIYKHFESLNQDVFESAVETAREGATEKEKEKGAIIDLARQWKQSHQTLHRLLEEIEQYKTGDTQW